MACYMFAAQIKKGGSSEPPGTLLAEDGRFLGSFRHREGGNLNCKDWAHWSRYFGPTAGGTG